MKFISIRKLKFYTKETLKLFNIALISFGFIISIILIKYKPMYEVKISGKEVGYIDNKDSLNEIIKKDIENYNGKNVNKVELTTKPEYELKLVDKKKQNNESEIIIALQKEVEITYKYFEISFEDKIIEKVDSSEIANQIVEEIKETTEGKTVLQVNEKI